MVSTSERLAQLVKASSPEPSPPAWPGYWRATECIGCPKAMIHRAYDHEPRRKYGSIILMELGLLLEDDMVARLMLQGIRVEDRDRTFQGLDNVPIVCHPDGFFRRNGAKRMAEFKSVDHEGFLEITNFGMVKANPLYNKQVQIYLHHAGRQVDVDEGTWLVMDRDTADYYDEDFSYQPEIAGMLNERIMIAKDAVDRGLDPDALQCSDDFFERLICRYNYSCGPIPPEISDPVLAQAAHRFLECKTIIGDADEVIEVCRNDIRQVMESRNVTSLRNYGITVTLRDERRTRTDFDLAEKLLSREQFDQIFDRRLNQVLRIERER